MRMSGHRAIELRTRAEPPLASGSTKRSVRYPPLTSSGRSRIAHPPGPKNLQRRFFDVPHGK
jgi:hypothetical protein